MKTTCRSCQNDINENATFCGQCGARQKCSSCSERLEPDANFCESCGAQIEDNNNAGTNSKAENKIVFKENKDGRTFEAEFTDPIGKDVVETFGKIVTNKQLISASANQTDIVSGHNSSEQTIDITSEVNGTDEETIPPKVESDQSFSSLPSLESIAMRNLPSSESEWVVVYAFYASEFGKKTFTRQDIIDAYDKSRRKNKDRINQLSPYITATVKSGDLNPLGDGLYSILDHGLKRAKEIVQRTSSSAPKKTRSSNTTKSESGGKSSSTKTSAKNIVQEKFDIHDAKKSLKDFFSEKDPGKSTGKRILTIAYYITNVLGKQSFSDGNIDYAYRALQLDKRPKHLRQQIINFKNSNAWFEEGENGSWKLSRNGEIYVEDNWS